MGDAAIKTQQYRAAFPEALLPFYKLLVVLSSESSPLSGAAKTSRCPSRSRSRMFANVRNSVSPLHTASLDSSTPHSTAAAPSKQRHQAATAAATALPLSLPLPCSRPASHPQRRREQPRERDTAAVFSFGARSGTDCCSCSFLLLPRFPFERCFSL